MSAKLSIICPMYKVVKFLPELIDSLILGANSQEIEILFVDDACPEGSGDACKQYLSLRNSEINFSYQVTILKENLGQAGARNHALAQVKSDYIGFLDSDDLISKEYWQVLSPQVTAGAQDIIEFSFQEFVKSVPVIGNECAPVNMVLSSELNPFTTGFFVWTRVFKRELLEGLSFPEGMIYEDIYFTVIAFSKAKSIAFIPEYLVYYRQREGSTTAIRTSSYSQLLENLINSVHQVISKSKVPNELMLALSQRCLLVVLKGINIKDSSERNKFYNNCGPLLKEAFFMNSINGKGYNKFIGSACLLVSNIVVRSFLLLGRFKK
jgi:glycosyltransferase involved in cell wall biosynthesis